MAGVTLPPDFERERNSLAELSVGPLVRKRNNNLLVREEVLSRSYTRQKIRVSGYQHNCIARVGMEEFQHLYRYSNIGFLLLVRLE